jgi:hypothetical protein
MRFKTHFNPIHRLALAAAATCVWSFPAATQASTLPTLPTLVWNANPEPDVTAYKVYIGSSSGVYPTVINISGDTRSPLPPVEEGATMYLAVSAVNSAGLEGPRSAELVVIADAPSPVVAPSFSMGSQSQGKLQWKYPAGAAIPANNFTVYSSDDLVNWTPASQIAASSPTSSDSEWLYFDFPYQADKPRMFFKVGASNAFGETL